jgi:hypothetical protein
MKHKDFLSLKPEQGPAGVVRVNSIRDYAFGDDPELRYSSEELEAAMFYVGKVGRLRTVHDVPHERAQAWGEVEFANGVRVRVTPADVEEAEEVTPEEFLPAMESDDEEYRKLTDDEVALAEKAVLALLSNSETRDHISAVEIWDRAVGIAMLRRRVAAAKWLDEKAL